jgi:GT2 family glycosyltransferase
MHELGATGLHEASLDELSGFLDPRLKRSASREHVELNPSQNALQQWLLDCCAAPGAISVSGFPSEPAADAELAEFEAAFDYHLEHGRGQAVIGTNARLAAIETLLAEHRNEREHWHQERAAQEERLEQSRQALAQAELTAAAHSADQAADIERFAAHAGRLEMALQAMRSSWSWKLTAPVRWIASPFQVRMNFDSEQRLYRFFYSLPGMNVARKRSLIVWLHEHAPWLTRHTLSYQLYEQARQLIDQQQNNRDYRARMQRMDERRAAALIEEIRDPPLISLVMPVYNVERRWLMAAVESVRRQFYPHWELCMADDASTREETQQALRDIAELGDARIRIQTLPKNLGIAGASNAALAMATGEYVGLLDNDDELARDALLEMARCIERDHPDFLYSDEDKIDENGFHVEPHFKPDFSPDFLASTNYICHFSVARRELLDGVGGFRAGFDGAQDYDLVLRICERTQKIAHIPMVLYHWRKIEGSTSATISAKPQTDDAGRRALAESLRRTGVDATAEPGPAPNTYRVRHAIHGNPRVSIIIPFRDKPELLDTCVSSILEKTSYSNYEILLVDNGSVKTVTQAVLARLCARDARVRAVRHDVPFNYSNIINFAAAQASGEHLLFLNNDTKIISAEWLEAMLEHSQRREVGVVGAKLLYEDDTVQHAGVIVGLGGVAGHSHLFAAADDPGYFRRAQLIQNLSAVTFACAMTRRDVFQQIGGLNERDLKIAFNDVDYCLRVREAGYQIVYTPFALLYHFESKSRGQDDTPEKKMRFDLEIR